MKTAITVLVTVAACFVLAMIAIAYIFSGSWK